MNNTVSLGIDTSNYSTSVCYFSSERITAKSQLLDIKKGERGLRQNEAFFQHVRNLPELLKSIEGINDVQCIGVSDRPRLTEGSYMPCFIAGKSVAEILSDTLSVPLYSFSHQQGHIGAAIYCLKKYELLKDGFFAFHNSGGTMELLYCKGIKEITPVSFTEDITAGQLVDRIGVKMGFDFPAGKYLSSLAMSSANKQKTRVSFKDGRCNLSGIENIASEMIDKGFDKETISAFVLDCISDTMQKMIRYGYELYGTDLPLIMVGGVNSSEYLKSKLQNDNVYFVDGDYSKDNAVGVAFLSSVYGSY